jgi:gliding motility-associated-like protein
MVVNLGSQSQTGSSVSFSDLCGGGQSIVVYFSDVCQANYTPEIAVPPLVEASFTANRYSTGEDDPSFILTSTSSNASSIFWEIPSLMNLNSTQNQWNVLLPAEAGEYQVILTAQDANGCSSQEEKTLTIRSPFAVYIPNSFTPNQDGINEVFAPQFSYPPLQYALSIFNRYGERIFYTTDYSQPWLGNHLGSEYFVPEGLYLWKYEAFGYDNEVKQEQGYVILTR